MDQEGANPGGGEIAPVVRLSPGRPLWARISSPPARMAKRSMPLALSARAIRCAVPLPLSINTSNGGLEVATVDNMAVLGVTASNGERVMRALGNSAWRSVKAGEAAAARALGDAAAERVS